MRLNCCLPALLLSCSVAAGCAETQTGPPEPTPFQKELATFLAEAETLKNLIEMGAPDAEREIQTIALRRAAAGLSPADEIERRQTASARELTRQIEYCSKLLHYAVDAKASKRKYQPVSEHSRRYQAETAEAFQTQYQAIDGLMRAFETSVSQLTE